MEILQSRARPICHRSCCCARRIYAIKISQSSSQIEIANILHVSAGTVNNDISYLREQAKYNIRKYIDEKLPYEYEWCVIGQMIKEASDTAESVDKRTKIQTLSLAKDGYAMKM